MSTPILQSPVSTATGELAPSVLFASSEAHPLIKTGGLGDVSSSLPLALRELGQDVRLVIPAYPQAKRQTRELKRLIELRLPGSPEPVQILGGLLPDRDLPVYLVDAPAHFTREGNPYTDVSGRDWGDNPERFLLFSRAIACIAMGLPALDWRPEVLHCNDWQTGLAPVLLRDELDRPSIVFTIHNLAYQGLFDRATFDRLKLPASLWSLSGLEFHQRLSFMKGGLLFSDRINTVSPTYAKEIKTPALGYGLDGLLRMLGSRFQGILNGIDYRTWNPAKDPALVQPYDADSLHLKTENKLELQHAFRLPRDEQRFVFGFVGRLVEQKGVDLILEVLPALLADPRIQLVVQGSGDQEIERQLAGIAAEHPDRIAIHLGYDEVRAHLIEAGVDAFLMPSRFEPCGLNQMYSLRYGTVPIVHDTGGLADTVINATEDNLARGLATGILFCQPEPDMLWGAMQRAFHLAHDRPGDWLALRANGMRQDLSWEASAQRYQAFYIEALASRMETQQRASA